MELERDFATPGVPRIWMFHVSGRDFTIQRQLTWTSLLSATIGAPSSRFVAPHVSNMHGLHS